MSRLIDLTGRVFGRLTVLNYAGLSASKVPKPAWLCQCSCGNMHTALGESLKAGSSRSCGCYKKDNSHRPHFKDLTGQTFGRLHVLSLVSGWTYDRSTGNTSPQWVCKCDCGVTKSISSGRLTSGDTVSCGCYNKEINHLLHFKDLTGKTFERLQVLEVDPAWTFVKGRSAHTRWLCRCSCGKIISTESTGLISGHTKSCGCWSADRAKACCGPLSPHWKPDLDPEERHHRAEHRHLTKQSRATRHAVYVRDNYTCRVCHQHGDKLRAHHIKAWNRFKEDRYRMLNVITLCKNCHDEFHKIYGKHEQTSHQFFEWWKHKKETQQNGKEHNTP